MWALEAGPSQGAELSFKLSDEEPKLNFGVFKSFLFGPNAVISLDQEIFSNAVAAPGGSGADLNHSYGIPGRQAAVQQGPRGEAEENGVLALTAGRRPELQSSTNTDFCLLVKRTGWPERPTQMVTGRRWRRKNKGLGDGGQPHPWRLACARAVPGYRGANSGRSCSDATGRKTDWETKLSPWVRGPLLKARPAGRARGPRSGAHGHRAAPQPYYHKR